MGCGQRAAYDAYEDNLTEELTKLAKELAALPVKHMARVVSKLDLHTQKQLMRTLAESDVAAKRKAALERISEEDRKILGL